MLHVIRPATVADLDAIRRIYNEGIEDRSTLEVDPKSQADIDEWWSLHGERYAVLVAVEDGGVAGWASLNRFSHRCAHSQIADLSVYVARAHRGRGIGSALLDALGDAAKAGGFHKIVLHAIDGNESGKRLYRKSGFVDVGIFREHGTLGGKYVDVIAMERLLGDIA